jgi:hypothetical protein
LDAPARVSLTNQLVFRFGSIFPFLLSFFGSVISWVSNVEGLKQSTGCSRPGRRSSIGRSTIPESRHLIKNVCAIPRRLAKLGGVFVLTIQFRLHQASTMSAGDAFWATLQFKHDLIQKFKTVQPDFFWLIVADGDPLVVSSVDDAPSTFFILCKPLKKASEQFGYFTAVRCEGESYCAANDKMKWVKGVAEKAVAQLQWVEK